MRIARFPASPSVAAMKMRPSFSMSILTPVSAMILLITLPPGPMTSLILSGLICIVNMRGANFDRSSRGCAMQASITSRIWKRASFAWARACSRISAEMPISLMSICSAVMPLRVPATLKSISPRASSMPWMSVRTRCLSPFMTRPIAMPPTGALRGTPASISASVLPQVEAIEVEPFDSSTSETRRMV